MSKTYQNLTDLRAEINEYGDGGADYYDKMIHEIPDTECVDRVAFILHKCLDKIVLDIGCCGPLHPQIEEVAKETWGIDKVDKPNPPIKNYWKLDIDNHASLDKILKDRGFELVICGEILEHLSNPGAFLDKIKCAGCPIILTAPNAFVTGSSGWLKKSKENVNKEHVAYYSYTTLKTLVTRHGFKIDEFYWAGEPHFFSEGIIFVISQGEKNG